MMPTIRIGADVFKALQSLAEPFTDTPESVIRRLLEVRGVLPSSRSNFAAPEKQSRARGLTPQSRYEEFLLLVLVTQFKGKGHKHEVTKAVEAAMRARGFLSPAAMEKVSSGETRAENTIAWARNALKERGLVSRASPRGIWELTPKGLKEGAELGLPSA
jgi:hypothetical protein